MLPGLMRTAATPCSIAFSARLALKWMSAMTGTGERRTMRPSASASSVFGTATRTISTPAETSSAICATVAGTSCVFVVVIDCTTTGAPPPIATPPTWIWRCEAIALDCRDGRRSRLEVPLDVVGDADVHHEPDEGEADRGEALQELAPERAAAYPFHQRDDDVPAVEGQEREQVQDPERDRDQRQDAQVVARARPQRLAGLVDDPHDARDLLPLLRMDESRQARDDLARDVERLAGRPLEGTRDGILAVRDAPLEAEEVLAVHLARRDRADGNQRAPARDDHGDAAPLGRLDDVVRLLGGRHLLAGELPDDVALEQAAFGSRRPRLHLRDGHRERDRKADHVHRREQDHRSEHVRERPGRDRDDAPPGRLPPVGARGCPLAELLDAVRGKARDRRGRQRGELPLERVEAWKERALVEDAQRGADVVDERGHLRMGGLERGEVALRVAFRRPEHPRDLHVAAQRDHADAVLDPVAPPADRRGREAEVELRRLHPDGPRREEVARLVDEDEEQKPDDADQVDAAGHARTGSRSATAA